MLNPSRPPFTILLGVLIGLSTVAVGMPLVALTDIARDFGESQALAQLTMSSFLLSYAAGQIFWGLVSDRTGRRPTLLLGMFLFAAGSLLCAVAPNIESLIAFRIVQAIGAAAGLVVARALARDFHSTRDTTRRLNEMQGIMLLAPVILPSIGALLLVSRGWRSIFVLILGIAIAIFSAVYWNLPEPERTVHAHSRQGRRFISEFLKNGTSILSVLLVGACSFALFQYIAGSPYLFIEVFGFSPAVFARIFGGIALFSAGVVWINSFTAHRFGPRWLIYQGILMNICGIIALLAIDPNGPTNIWLVISAITFINAGIVTTIPTATAIAIRPFPQAAGTAAGILGTFQLCCAAASSSYISVAFDGSFRAPLQHIAVSAGLAVALALLLSLATRSRAASVGRPSH